MGAGCTGTLGPLLWAVIRHWLTIHWELGPGEAVQDQQDSR